jgi:hypothetical protein
MATTKNAPTSTGKAAPKGNTGASKPKVESEKVYGGYTFGYNVKTHEWTIKGVAKPGEHIDTTPTGKPVYARNEPRLVEFKASNGRTLRFAVYVDELPQESDKAPEVSAPAGVSAQEWADFQQFQAWKRSQGGK